MAFRFHFLHNITGLEIKWNHSRLHVRVYFGHLSVCLSCTIKTNKCFVIKFIAIVTKLKNNRERPRAGLTIQTSDIRTHPVTTRQHSPFSGRKESRVIRRSSYVGHPQQKRTETTFQAQVTSPLWLSLSHAKYPLSSSVLRFSVIPHSSCTSFSFFSFFLSFSNNRMSAFSHIVADLPGKEQSSLQL